MKTGYKPRTSLDQQPVSLVTTLPTNEPVALYYRQSSMKQIGNTSTEIQTVDLVAELKRRGWSEENIIPVDMDAGVSGTKKIIDRPGMRYLYDLITQGKISAVFCQDEDRLFRDFTMIQPNIFIQACTEANVLVLTPSMIYDFNHPQMGDFYVKMFRAKCEMAADYLKRYMKGVLQAGKHKRQMEGKWTGSVVPVGFMVDIREHLPDGSQNPRWKFFTTFEPYALVLREYFDLFLRYAGNLRATLKHIYEHGPYLPDPELTRPPEGFKVKYHSLTRKSGHYVPGRNSLAKMLTNVVYLGWWTVQGTVVRTDNHDAIVPLAVFMRAYNYLSETDFEGNPNPHYVPFRQYSHSDKEETRPTDGPLCAGMIYATYEGEPRRVGAMWSRELGHYLYALRTPQQVDHIWSKSAKAVDEKVVSLIRHKLEAAFDDTAWKQALDELRPDYDRACRLKKAELAEHDRAIEGSKVRLGTLMTPDLIRDEEAHYGALVAERAHLVAELSAAQEDRAELDALYDLKERCEHALKEWDTISQNERRAILHGLIERIDGTRIEEGAVEFTVHWRGGGSDRFTLAWQGVSGSSRWLPSETERLMALVDMGASQVELCAAFPDRTWEGIWRRIYNHGERPFKVGRKLIHKDETYRQYEARCEQHSQVGTRSGLHDKFPTQVAPFNLVALLRDARRAVNPTFEVEITGNRSAATSGCLR